MQDSKNPINSNPESQAQAVPAKSAKKKKKSKAKKHAAATPGPSMQPIADVVPALVNTVAAATIDTTVENKKAKISFDVAKRFLLTKEYKDAKPYLDQAAKQGHPDAAVLTERLGKLPKPLNAAKVAFTIGEYFLTTDLITAELYLTKAAKLEYPPALELMSKIFVTVMSPISDATPHAIAIQQVAINPADRLRFLKKLLDGNQITHNEPYKMGLYYTAEKKYDLAISHFELAASKGSLDALLQLGVIYLEREEVVLAFEWFKKAAEAGSATAQCMVADLYQAGKGVQEDSKLAVSWLQKAVAQNDPVAIYQLGLCYMKGNGVEKNGQLALQQFRKIAEQESEFQARVQFCIGEIYLAGMVKEKDAVNKGIKWLRKAAEKNNPMALTTLGCCYINGLGVTPNKEEAAKCYQQAAKQCYAPALVYLAKCYANGFGVKQNWSFAIQLMKKAADAGSTLAAITLAEDLLSGKYIEKDERKAIEYLQKAIVHANQGEKIDLLYGEKPDEVYGQVFYQLALCYLKGIGVEENVTKAIELLKRSAEYNFQEAQAQLGMILCIGLYGAPVDEVTAAFYFRQAAELGNSQGQYFLAVCYLAGKGVERNKLEAVLWFRKAAAQDHALARTRLAECYFQGIGVEKDSEMGLVWLLGGFSKDQETTDTLTQATSPATAAENLVESKQTAIALPLPRSEAVQDIAQIKREYLRLIESFMALQSTTKLLKQNKEVKNLNQVITAQIEELDKLYLGIATTDSLPTLKANLNRYKTKYEELHAKIAVISQRQVEKNKAPSGVKPARPPKEAKTASLAEPTSFAAAASVLENTPTGPSLNSQQRLVDLKNMLALLTKIAARWEEVAEAKKETGPFTAEIGLAYATLGGVNFVLHSLYGFTRDPSYACLGDNQALNGRNVGHHDATLLADITLTTAPKEALARIRSLLDFVPRLSERVVMAEANPSSVPSGDYLLAMAKDSYLEVMLKKKEIVRSPEITLTNIDNVIHHFADVFSLHDEVSLLTLRCMVERYTAAAVELKNSNYPAYQKFKANHQQFKELSRRLRHFHPGEVYCSFADIRMNAEKMMARPKFSAADYSLSMDNFPLLRDTAVDVASSPMGDILEADDAKQHGAVATERLSQFGPTAASIAFATSSYATTRMARFNLSSSSPSAHLPIKEATVVAASAMLSSDRK